MFDKPTDGSRWHECGSAGDALIIRCHIISLTCRTICEIWQSNSAGKLKWLLLPTLFNALEECTPQLRFLVFRLQGF